VLIGLIVSIFFASFYPPIAFVLIGFFLTLGLILPLLAQLVSRNPGSRLITQRADLHTQLVDGIQGLADLLASDAEKTALADRKNRQTTARHKSRWRASAESIQRLERCSPTWVVARAVSRHSTSDRGNINGVMLGTLTLMTLASFEAVTPAPRRADVECLA
jgi:ATP-binding cassette, subfamily C, bacterial CydC